MDYNEFRTKIRAMAQDRGSETTGHLIEIVVTEREDLTPDSALAAAEKMNWDLVWEQIIGPAIDLLGDELADNGAHNNPEG